MEKILSYDTIMGAEVFAITGGIIVSYLTWSHNQRVKVIDQRFDIYKERIHDLENRVNEMPIKFVLKVDLEVQLEDMRTRLRDINDKLDQLIMRG
jgi:hypothetical protein